MKAIVAVVVLLSAVNLEAQKALECSNPLRWTVTREKMRDSSLNSTYHYEVGNEGLAHTVNGLISLAAAFEAETESNTETLCRIVENQQAQLDELRAQLASLRKQIAQTKRTSAPAPSRRTTPASPAPSQQ
jgi:phage shock protein A